MRYQSIIIFTLSIANLLVILFAYFHLFIFKRKTNSSQAESSLRIQDLLTELNGIMASTILLEDLVDKLLTKLFTELQISEGALLLISENRISWAKTIGYTTHPVFDEKVLIHLIEKNDKEIIIVNELEDSTVKHYLLNNKREIVIPLKAKGIIEGALVLGKKTTNEQYSPDDIRMLEFLAPELAISIKNAESYEEIRKFNESLQREIEIATSDMKKINEEMYKKNVDLKHISDQLAEANLKLKQFDKLKDEFVSLASHELRTPMTAIKSYLWLFLEMKDLPLNEKQKTYIERAYQSTDRLISLVNDMLNVSRIESGRLNITIKPFDLNKLLTEVIQELKPSAIKQQVNLELVLTDNNLPSALGDINKIREVIINLVGNSLKFTTPGGTITIRIYRDKDMIITQVKDTGKGISQEDLPKLFHKFQTVGSNYLTKMNSQGTGLGLYLSKSIVAMHDGTIWAESEGEGKGSSFFFSLKTDSNKASISDIPVASPQMPSYSTPAN